LEAVVVEPTETEAIPTDELVVLVVAVVTGLASERLEFLVKVLLVETVSLTKAAVAVELVALVQTQQILEDSVE
jgi:hypothetical protein